VSIIRWKFAFAGPPDVRTIIQRILEQYPDPREETHEEPEHGSKHDSVAMIG
jgi:hypothetical protein